MSILVEQQDETLDVIEDTAAHVEKDTEVGLSHTMKAVDSGRAARKKRWICFGLIVLLLIIVAIIIAVVVTNNSRSKRSFFTSYVVRLLTDSYRIINPCRGSRLVPQSCIHAIVTDACAIQCLVFVPSPTDVNQISVFFCGFRVCLLYITL